MPELTIGYITNELGATASIAKLLVERVADARTLIVEFGARLQAFISQMNATDVEVLGLRVRVVLRGTPFIGTAPEDLSLEYLPAVDDEDYDTRPGATALYLEAFGEGNDRVYAEIRSNPGSLVSASSSLNELNSWLGKHRPVLGIVRDVTGPRLVRQWADSDVHTEKGPDALEFFASFIAHLRHEVQRRARFNRAVDLR